jgi:hypothetical protein
MAVTLQILAVTSAVKEQSSTFLLAKDHEDLVLQVTGFKLAWTLFAPSKLWWLETTIQ